MKLSKERRDPSPYVLPDPEETAADPIGDPTPLPTVSVTSEPAKQEAADPDGALKLAIKAALDAGDLDRAEQLLAILKSAPKIAPVIRLAKKT